MYRFLLLSVCLFSLSHVTYAATETFESIQLNGQASSGSGWSSNWNGDNGYKVVGINIPSEGEQHVKITPIVDNFVKINRRIATTSSSTIYFDVKVDTLSGYIRGDLNLYSNNTLLMRVLYGTGISFQQLDLLYWTGTINNWYRQSTTFPNDTYVTIGIQFDQVNQGNKYRINMNGGSWSPWMTMYNNPTFNGVNTIELGASNYNAVSGGSLYYDHIIVN